MALVYIATSPSGKHYVGRTTQDLGVRKRTHLSVGRVRDRHRPFSKAILKYGREAFRWAILAEGLTVEESMQVERAFIKLLGTLSPRGYNLTTGGETTEHHPATRKRISEALTGRKRPEISARLRAANLGKVHGAEHRRKTGEASRRAVRTPAWKAAISEGKRKLTAAQAMNVCFLVRLGATRSAVGSWFGLDRSTITHVVDGSHGWSAVLASFSEPSPSQPATRTPTPGRR